MSIITLSTDFGLKDGNVGAMRGVIWGIAPDAQLSELSNLISPQNILEGALILSRAVPFYPAGTIHIMVVDPGVGTTRRPIAARIGTQYYVVPDNGLITLVLEAAEKKGETVEIVHLDKPQYWLPEISHVFHGRDIFAPSAAHLASGVPLADLGTAITDPVRLKIPHPVKSDTGWRGDILYIDSFGNLSSNLMREDLPDTNRLSVHIDGTTIDGLVNTFGERPVGDLIALFGSSGNLIVSEVNGSAARRLNAKVGDPIDVRLLDR